MLNVRQFSNICLQERNKSSKTLVAISTVLFKIQTTDLLGAKQLGLQNAVTKQTFVSIKSKRFAKKVKLIEECGTDECELTVALCVNADLSVACLVSETCRNICISHLNKTKLMLINQS